MGRRLILTAGGLAVALAVGAARSAPTDADQQALAAGWNGFGLKLLGTQPRDQNLCFSPYSAAACLTMAYAGARGKTATQMADVLGLSLPPERLHAAAGELGRRLARLDGSKRVELRVANALWTDRADPPLSAFQDLLRAHYAAGAHQLDFVGAPEHARQAINHWASDQTRGHIPELLGQGLIDRNTALVLTNAVYLQAPWLTAFKVVEPGDFTRADDQVVTASMMSGAFKAPYAECREWAAVQLPYKNDDLAMLLILPSGKLADFEATFDAEALQNVVNCLQPAKLGVTLPSFEQRSNLHLAAALQSLGMTDAFDHLKADFTGMFPPSPVWIGAVEHQAWIKTDRKGTTAAAATAAPMAGKAEPAPAFRHLRFDRPFLFVVRHTPSRVVLFLGRVADPSSGGPARGPAPREGAPPTDAK
jgi:serpin B